MNGEAGNQTKEKIVFIPIKPKTSDKLTLILVKSTLSDGCLIAFEEKSKVVDNQRGYVITGDLGYNSMILNKVVRSLQKSLLNPIVIEL